MLKTMLSFIFFGVFFAVYMGHCFLHLHLLIAHAAHESLALSFQRLRQTASKEAILRNTGPLSFLQNFSRKILFQQFSSFFQDHLLSDFSSEDTVNDSFN